MNIKKFVVGVLLNCLLSTVLLAATALERYQDAGYCQARAKLKEAAVREAKEMLAQHEPWKSNKDLVEVCCEAYFQKADRDSTEPVDDSVAYRNRSLGRIERIVDDVNQNVQTRIDAILALHQMGYDISPVSVFLMTTKVAGVDTFVNGMLGGLPESVELTGLLGLLVDVSAQDRDALVTQKEQLVGTPSVEGITKIVRAHKQKRLYDAAKACWDEEQAEKIHPLGTKVYTVS